MIKRSAAPRLSYPSGLIRLSVGTLRNMRTLRMPGNILRPIQNDQCQSTRHRPYQNGTPLKANAAKVGTQERANRTLREKAASMIQEQRLSAQITTIVAERGQEMLRTTTMPEMLWPEAIRNAVWLKYRSPTKAHKYKKTPFEAVEGIKPDFLREWVWGSRAYVTIPTETRIGDPKLHTARGWLGYTEGILVFYLKRIVDGQETVSTEREKERLRLYLSGAFDGEDEESGQGGEGNRQYIVKHLDGDAVLDDNGSRILLIKYLEPPGDRTKGVMVFYYKQIVAGQKTLMTERELDRPRRCLSGDFDGEDEESGQGSEGKEEEDKDRDETEDENEQEE